MSDKKCYSTNNEDFSHDCIEEAINDRLSDEFLASGTVITIYEGDAVKQKAGNFAKWDVIDELSCSAGDECGEYADDWPNCTKEQSDDLDERIAAVVNQWADDHGLQPNFYTVENVKEIQVELLDIDGNYKILEI